MSEIATNDFLTLLRSVYPTKPSTIEPNRAAELVENPWYLVAAVTFSASNRPDGVPRVFEFVMAELSSLSATHEDKQRFVLRMREALFKGGMISGYSRAISALTALYDVTPEDLRVTKLVREADNDKVSDWIARGDSLFRAMYGDTADSVQTLLDAIHPDMGWFSKNIAYGHVYNAPEILAQRDTSYAIVAALIAMDTPRQVGWHLANCHRGGASREEVSAVRDIAMHVAKACGIKWRQGVPEIQE